MWEIQQGECSFDSIPITTGVFVIFLVQLCGYFCYFQTLWSELTKNELHDFFKSGDVKLVLHTAHCDLKWAGTVKLPFQSA